MLNIKVTKDGVLFELNGEEVKLDDKTIDALAKNLVSYICFRDNISFKIYGDIFGSDKK
ncbi:hypothetical protein ACDQ58_06410 [Fusobacterium animalis]|uniref:hypothetical protein n=1 Tax=Fusobacterium animalis TaxID=76859 RepID=UPI0035570FAA